MKEIWKDIKGYEGLYQVSNLGRVKSFRVGGKSNLYVKEGVLLKFGFCMGYCKVTLVKNGVKKTGLIHRLVAQAFIDNKKNKTQVNHKDGDKQNNDVNNLEWVTPSENMKHAYRVLGLEPNKPQLGLQKGKSKFSKKVVAILNGKVLYRFDSVIETKDKGFTPSLVASCARGEQSHHKNLIWKYV